jgi:cell division protein FtsW
VSAVSRSLAGSTLTGLAQRWRERRTAQANRLPIVDRVAPAPATHLAGFDQPLVGVVLALLLFGLVMVYSASIALADGPKYAHYLPTHFLVRHAIAVALGLTTATLVALVPIRIWERFSPWLFASALLLLAAVLMPHIGKGVNGAQRWIPLGLINFQPSEWAKLGIAMYAANYMVRKMEVKEDFGRAVWPMAVALAVAGALLLAEPDMGAFIVIAVIALGILFLGGVNGRMFLVSLAVLLATFSLIIAVSPWRRQRIFAFVDPFDPAYAQGKGYQLVQSLIAFGRGKVLGEGLGGSLGKLHYLPDAHTDFILAVIGEELGFVGVFCVIAAFFWLTRRIFIIGRQAVALDRVFAGLLAQGIGIWIGAQALINIGVNLGALPTKGLTLPLLSYGGSAILMLLFALAIVVRVDIENRQLMRGGRT